MNEYDSNRIFDLAKKIGYSPTLDIDESNCGTDPLNATDFPSDLNGDGLCDSLDNDWDDDGIPRR